MKKILLPLFLLFFGHFFAQISPESYQIKKKAESINISLEKIEMLDLYRSQDFDNEITLVDQGKTIVFTLLSATKLKTLGIPFNDGLVQKGGMMAGNPTSSRKYKIELTPEKSLNYISTY